MSEAIKLSDLLEKVRTESSDKIIRIGDILDILENRGYGPLLLAVALMTLLPTGAIPGVPTLTAILVLFITPQMLIGRSHPWIPERIKNRRIEKAKFEKLEAKTLTFTKRIDRFIKPRWHFMLQPIGLRFIAIAVCLLAMTMPPLELLPFVAFIPASAIAFFALGLSAKDGALVFIGYLLTFFAIAVGFNSWLF